MNRLCKAQPQGFRDCICATCGAEGITRQPDPVWCPACLQKRLLPGQRIAHCKCGAIGIEDARDPAPGLCPACLKSKLDDSGEALRQVVEDE